MEVNYFTILYWFCHTSTWIHHRYTRVPHPDLPSLLPPYTIPLGRPSAPAPSIQYHASNRDWRFVSYMILYMLQCHSPKSSHPLPLSQSPKDCFIHLCLFCCLAYRVIITIFLNFVYMCSLERMMLKLKLQYFGHLMWRVDSLEKTVMLGGIGGRRRRGWQRMRWLDGCESKWTPGVVDG